MGTTRTTIKMLELLMIFIFIASTVGEKLVPNYDVSRYKFLNVGTTLDIVCNNTYNKDPIQWVYPDRLKNDPRMTIQENGRMSHLEIKNASADDAGEYICSIGFEYIGNKHTFNKTIVVIVNKITQVLIEKTENSVKLQCDLQAYPTPHVYWTKEPFSVTDYDKSELNPKSEATASGCQGSLNLKQVIDKPNGRLILRQYNGVNHAELLIFNFTKEDEGIYCCISEIMANNDCKEIAVGPRKTGNKVAFKETSTISNTNDYSGQATNVARKESRPHDPVAKGGFETTAGVSTINVLCLVGIVLGNIMLGLLILQGVERKEALIVLLRMMEEKKTV
ncbi:hypothetical protein B566_EDAN008031 [Ephemera danica]|nr:hypothetical protein B566_EDAN008031 [Ephemera danica]